MSGQPDDAQRLVWGIEYSLHGAQRADSAKKMRYYLREVRRKVGAFETLLAQNIEAALQQTDAGPDGGEGE